MSKRRRARQKPNTGQSVLAVAVAVVGVLLLLGGWALVRRLAKGPDTTLRDSDTAFSIPTHVGQPAPTFTAIGVDGQPYTVTPGGGRPTAIVFYMGFG